MQSLKLERQLCSPASAESAEQFISPKQKKQRKITIASSIKLLQDK